MQSYGPGDAGKVGPLTIIRDSRFNKLTHWMHWWVLASLRGAERRSNLRTVPSAEGCFASLAMTERNCQSTVYGFTAANKSRGFTILEVVIALGVSGLLVATLAGTLSLTMAQVPKQGAKMAVENRLELARYWITRDANSSESYTLGTSPQYGTFAWRDFSGEATVNYQTIYYYDPTLGALMRQEKRDSITQSTFQVAADILQEGDVAFNWSAAQQKVTVVITPTIQEAHAVGDISRTGTLVAFLRYEAEGVVSPPGEVPIPTPPPGSQTYYVAATPAIFTGTYVSGNAASLQSADTDYYRVDSVSEGGSKVVSWEAYSQTMTAPPTISQIEVRFTGRVTKNNVAMEFFVKDASGYPPNADFAFTFTEEDTEETRSFYLDAAALSYINTTEVVYLKVTATGGSTFTLDANQVLFIASP